MNLEVVFWVLEENSLRFDRLRQTISDAALVKWSGIAELHEKIWIENEEEGWWGAIMVWHSEKPDLSSLPENTSKGLINRPPDFRLSFNVAAIASSNQNRKGQE